MSIQERLQADLKQAMRERDQKRVDVIRSARDALQKAQLEAAKQRYDVAARQIEEQFADDPDARDRALAAIAADHHETLSDEEQERVMVKAIKQRRDAADIYRKGGKTVQADEEENEARLLEVYLPQQLGEEELRPQIAAIIAEMGLSGPSAMRSLMPVLMERLKGRADGRMLSQLARDLLGA